MKQLTVYFGSSVRRVPGTIFLAALLLVFLSGTLEARTSFRLPDGAKDARPGKYDLTVKFSGARDAHQGVRAMLYVPAFKNKRAASKRPLVVFFHGMTGNRYYYRDQVQYMIARADRDRFTLLSVQNWWAFTRYFESIIDSQYATNAIAWQLIDAGAVNEDAVYTTGFSSGGLAAVMTMHNSLDERGLKRKKPLERFPYAGFASFKGNYYPRAVQLNPFVDPEPKTFHKYYRKMYKNKIALFTVGGARDAARVQQQAPEAHGFFTNYMGVPAILKKFPQEGHNLSASNWSLFWQMVESKL